MSCPEVHVWLQAGERGLSSETMVEVFEGFPLGTLTGKHRGMMPHDPADLRRCLLLLEAVPAYKPRLAELASVNDRWAALVGAWDELTALLVEEIGSINGYGRAPRTAARMFALLYPQYAEVPQ